MYSLAAVSLALSLSDTHTHVNTHTDKGVFEQTGLLVLADSTYQEV